MRTTLESEFSTSSDYWAAANDWNDAITEVTWEFHWRLKRCLEINSKTGEQSHSSITSVNSSDGNNNANVFLL